MYIKEQLSDSGPQVVESCSKCSPGDCPILACLVSCFHCYTSELQARIYALDGPSVKHEMLPSKLVEEKVQTHTPKVESGKEKPWETKFMLCVSPLLT